MFVCMALLDLGTSAPPPPFVFALHRPPCLASRSELSHAHIDKSFTSCHTQYMSGLPHWMSWFHSSRYGLVLPPYYFRGTRTRVNTRAAHALSVRMHARVLQFIYPPTVSSREPPASNLLQRPPSPLIVHLWRATSLHSSSSSYRLRAPPRPPAPPRPTPRPASLSGM